MQMHLSSKRKALKRQYFLILIVTAYNCLLLLCYVQTERIFQDKHHTVKLVWFGVFLIFGRTQTLSALKSPPGKSGLFQV